MEAATANAVFRYKLEVAGIVGGTLRNKLIEVRRQRRRATLEEVDPAVACAAAAPRHEQATRDALVSEKGPLPVHLINAAVSGREMRPWRRKRGRKGGIHRPFDPSSSPFLVSPLFGIFQAKQKMWQMSFRHPWSFLSILYLRLVQFMEV